MWLVQQEDMLLPVSYFLSSLLCRTNLMDCVCTILPFSMTCSLRVLGMLLTPLLRLGGFADS